MQDPIDVQDFEGESVETQETGLAREQFEAQIRNSVVGKYITSHNRRMRALNREVVELRQRLEDQLAGIDQRISQQDGELKAEIRNLSPKVAGQELGLTLEKIEGLIDAKLDARLDGITARGEADLQRLSTLINDFANEFQTQIDRLKNEVKLLREQGRQNQESLRTELISETEALEMTKVDRLTLADTLIMLGMKLKDEDLLDEFGINLDFDEGADENLQDDLDEVDEVEITLDFDESVDENSQDDGS